MRYKPNKLKGPFGVTVVVALLAMCAPNTFAQNAVHLEEIIVTAQRRAENLQDVPLSVTSISGDSLITNDIQDARRLELVTPGLTFGRTGTFAMVSIRGARTEGILVNTEPVVAFYNDGVYRRGTQQALYPMMDVEAVEVLRGPQGTLFGRNSYGGAINIRTNRPTDEFDFGVSSVIGTEKRTDIQGFVNYAFNDVVAVRLAGARLRRDGFVENTFESSEDLMDRDEDFFRGQLRFSFNENVELLIRGEHWSAGGNGSGDFVMFTPGTIRAAGPDGVPSIADPGFTFGEIVPVNTLGGARLSAADTDPYKLARDVDFINDTEMTTIAAELDWTFGPVQAKVLVSYADYENLHTGDADFSQFVARESGQFDFNETWQQEIHISSNTEGPIDWLIGAFFMQDDTGDSFFYDGLHRPLDPGGNCFGFLSDSPIVTTGSAVQNCKVADPNLVPGEFYFGNRRNQQTDSVAGFGQGALKLFDERLRLTGGVRYSRDEKEFRLRDLFDYPADGPDDFRDTDFTVNDTTVFEIVDLESSFEKVTWRAAADFYFQPEKMIYGSVSTGFSSGGFNSVANPVTGEFTFDEQNVTAYEIGAKSTLLDGALKLNIAVYHNDFEQILAEPDEFVFGTVIIFNEVGGDGEATGVDVELDWAATPRLLFNLRFSYMDAEFGDFVTGSGSDVAIGNATRLGVDGTQQPAADVSGLEIPFSPEFTLGLTAQYMMSLGEFGTLVPRVNFYFSDEYWTADQHYPISLQDSYTKTDLSLTWISADEHWQLQGFLRNIEDAAVIQRTNVGGSTQIGQFFGEPFHAGLRLSYGF